MRLIYVVGAPGSGKSTLMAALTEEYDRMPLEGVKLPRDGLLRDGQMVGVELGKRRGSFSGTDALAMNIHPLALAWMSRATIPLVFGEGQRLGTQAFLQTAVRAGRAVDLVWLDPPPEVCQARREARGSNQNPQWVKAATTRAARLAATALRMPGVTVTQVPAPGGAREVAEHVRRSLGLDLSGAAR